MFLDSDGHADYKKIHFVFKQEQSSEILQKNAKFTNFCPLFRTSNEMQFPQKKKEKKRKANKQTNKHKKTHP